MSLKILFCLLLISVGTFFPKQMLGIEYYIIPKCYHYKIDENTTKYAGFSYNYYNKHTDILDSCVTFRSDKVIPNSRDLITYLYNSDLTVKQILTFHFKGVRRSPAASLPPLPFYSGIIPIPQIVPPGLVAVPWVETLKYNTSGILGQKLEVSHVPESPFFIDNELFYYNENGELNKYTHLASYQDPVLEWDTITRDMYMYSNPSKNIKITTILTWDTANLGWVNKKKNETITNPVGQQISSIDSCQSMSENPTYPVL